MPRIKSDTLLTSHQVSELLQVSPTSINNWIRDGRIAAFRTPGGHRRIKACDLVAFLVDQKIPIPEQLTDAAHKRLLLVEDDPHLLKAFGRFFKKYSEQLTVLLVENGIDALVQIGSFQPHLAVLDVMMPGIDGIEVCERLKASDDTKDIGIIFFSGQMTDELRERALRAGAQRCMSKPLDIDSILLDLGIQPR